MINIPHLETDITVACHLSCVSCNHLVVPYRSLGKIWHSDPGKVEKDLKHLSTIMHAAVWGALGGEPLLHPQLTEILQIVRASGICDKIEVWTNGIEVHRYGLDHPFWKSFDVLVLSLYDSKKVFYAPMRSQDPNRPTDAPGVKLIQDHCDRAGIELVIKNERTWHNFRTNLEPTPTDYETTKAKYRGCFFRHFSRVANDGYFYTCCCLPHQPELLQGRPRGSDGIRIEGLTEAGLRAYLDQEEPHGACHICAGRDTAKPIEWSEERDLETWVRKSKGLQKPDLCLSK